MFPSQDASEGIRISVLNCRVPGNAHGGEKTLFAVRSSPEAPSHQPEPAVSYQPSAVRKIKGSQPRSPGEWRRAALGGSPRIHPRDNVPSQRWASALAGATARFLLRK